MQEKQTFHRENSSMRRIFYYRKFFYAKYVPLTNFVSEISAWRRCDRRLPWGMIFL